MMIFAETTRRKSIKTFHILRGGMNTSLQKISELCNVDRLCGKYSRGNAEWTLSNRNRKWGEKKLKAAQFLSAQWGTTNKNKSLSLCIKNLEFQWWSSFSSDLICSICIDFHSHTKKHTITHIWNTDVLSNLQHSSENKDYSWFTSWDMYIIRHLTRVSFSCKHIWNAWSHTNLQSVSLT